MTARKKKPAPKKPAKKKKKTGAQANNKNALKHGFYSAFFSREEKFRLDLQPALDILAEINLARVLLDKLKDEISFKEISRTDNNGSNYRDDHYLSQLSKATDLMVSIATLTRTDYLIHPDKKGSVQTSILTALEELRLEMGI
jgi:hypothetical protein